MWTILLSLCAWIRAGKVAEAAAPESGQGTPSAETEFTAEVVRVVEVLPHPNADRLEIVRFELRGSGVSAYDVVIQKGEFRRGDLASYLSVDCIVPTDKEEFKFLLTRMDGAGKTHYRLRAARLRGTFSQGLLVKVPYDKYGVGFEFGRSVAEHYGVTYHRAPEPAGIPSQPGVKRTAQPCPVYGVESLKKVPRLFELGEIVSVTEKIHGCNFRFGWVPRKFLGIRIGWRFVVGSHRVMKGDGSAGFYGEDLWLSSARKMNLAHKTRDYKGHVFYGELYGYTEGGTAIQDLTYGAKPKETRLAVFDVLKLSGQEWYRPKEREWALVDCDLPSVPLLYIGEYTPALLDMAEGKSALDGKTQREGVVIEALWGRRRKAKFVGQGYLLRKGA